jgi:hypothetical protein
MACGGNWCLTPCRGMNATLLDPIEPTTGGALGVLQQRVEPRSAEHPDLGPGHEVEASFFDPEPESEPEPELDEFFPSEEPDDPEPPSEPEDEPLSLDPEPDVESAFCFSDPELFGAERLSVA